MAAANQNSHPVSGLKELLLSAALTSGASDRMMIEEALSRATFAQQSLVGAVIATGAVQENEFLRELSSLLAMEWREEAEVIPASDVRTTFPARLALGFQILPEATPKNDGMQTEALRILIWDPFGHDLHIRYRRAYPGRPDRPSCL